MEFEAVGRWGIYFDHVNEPAFKTDDRAGEACCDGVAVGGPRWFSRGSVESPIWLNDILGERGERVAEGKAHFVDWETAKKDIRSKIS